MKENKQVPALALVIILTVNLIFGFRAYSEDINKKEDKVESVRVLVDAVSILRKNYVDADKVNYQRLVYAALEGMVKELDKHSRFHTPVQNEAVKEDNDGKFAGIGVILNFKDKQMTVKKLIPDGPAEKGGLKAGDIILKVDGYTLKGEGFSEAKKYIKGHRGTEVILVVQRGPQESPEEVEVRLIRDIVKVPSITRNRILKDSGIGYLHIAQFTRDTAVDFRNALGELTDKGAKGVIIDLRGNPGGMLNAAIQMCSYFLNKDDLVLYTKGRDKDHERKYFALGGIKFTNLPIVILIDGGSASASEILSACLHDYDKAVLVGEKSYGKGSVQTIVDLRDGSALRFTIAKYYTKSGSTIHNVGIDPDIEIKLTKEEKKEVSLMLNDLYPLDEELTEYDKKDRQLQAAISVLDKLVAADTDKEPLKVFTENKSEILQEVNKFLNVSEKVKPKEDPSSNK